MVRATRLSFALIVPLLAACPAAAQSVTLLDFSLPTCAPCRQMDPVVARLESDGFRIERIDGSRQPRVAQKFRVDQYPTFVILADRQEVKRVVGPTSYTALKQMMQRAGAGAAAPGGAAGPTTFAQSAAGTPARPASFDRGAPPVTMPGAEDAQATPADRQTLLNASVRLRVDDATGHSYGTGTIVDARQGQALVLTCAHLFRGPDGKVIQDSSAVTVEIFQAGPNGPQVVERVPVLRIESYNFDSDVAFVSIRPKSRVRPVRIAAAPGGLSEGDPLRSVGCNHGDAPTVREGQLTAINRYQGAANFTTTGAPVVGRSGGGLFNARGELVGVCFAADTREDEGLYAALPAIHEELDNKGLAAIYSDAAPENATGAVQPASHLVPVNPRVVRGQEPPASLPQGLSRSEHAALAEIGARAAESEVVCVIRPKTPGARSEVITLDRVSPAFVRALSEMRGAAASRGLAE